MNTFFGIPVWIWFAALAPFLFAWVNQIDSFLVKKVKTIGALVIFSSLFAIVTVLLSLGVVLAQNTSLSLPIHQIIILLVSGCFEIIWIVWYLKALDGDGSESEVSSVVPWFQTIPVFVLVLSFLFLGERISGLQALGILIVVVGSFLLSRDWTQKFKFKARGTMLMLGSSFLIAVASILYKATAIDVIPFWVSMFWVQLGILLTGVGLCFYTSYRKDFLHLIRTSGRAMFAYNALNEILNLSGVLAVFYACFLAPVSYVYTVSALQPVFLLIISIVLSRIAPRFVHEDLSRRNLIPKILAILLMVVGAILVTLS